MTQQIDLQIPAQTLSVPLPKLLLILADQNPAAKEFAADLPAAISSPLQGGIYAGPAVEGGKLIHLIAAPDCLGKHKWAEAKEAASECRAGGFDDWQLAEKSWLQIARANGLDLPREWHWGATPYGPRRAWAVDFESGGVSNWLRTNEFRVRPFRRFIP